MSIINFTMPQTSGFLVDIIIWLVKTCSSIAVGIILFTVLLKLITLPFDYFSRASMRKNSLKMEEMRPELEKLQKQYADNKELYSQKMMALYKKNGYSMFGSCLPTILTLVIFIIAINAFTNYSQYQNKLDFYHMSQSYNNVVYAGFDIDEENKEFIFRGEDGIVYINNEKIFAQFEAELADETIIEANKEFGLDNKIKAKLVKVITQTGETKTLTGYELEITTTNAYSKVNAKYDAQQKQTGALEFYLTDNAVEILSLDNPSIANEENNFLKNSAGKTFSQAYAEVEATENAPTKEEYIKTFMSDIQSYCSAQRFRQEQARFLWIKNIWITDSAFKNPVMKSWDEFNQTHEYIKEGGYNIGEAGYNRLIYHLGEETKQANGYFILVVLTILTSLAQQIIMGKSQKAQMELQTVDGQGAQSQKMMQWMMPIMMGFFAFMYTSAFSIYIIISSVFSILTTFGINAIVNAQFKKEKAKTATEEIRGRVYTPKEEPKKSEKETKKKKDETPDNDFLSGKADNKRGKIRGRIK